MTDTKATQQLEFQYNHDCDENGILHWLATVGSRYTERGHGKQWYNPADKVQVTLSSVSGAFEFPSYVVLDRSTQEEKSFVATKGEKPNQWIQFDFGTTLRIQPTAYTLESAEAFFCQLLRNWQFQGSNDGKVWATIRDHIADESLTTKPERKVARASWQVGDKMFYRYFRVIQTGPNADGNHILALRRFELYGKVLFV